MVNQNLRYILWRRYWENPRTEICSMNENCYVCGNPLKFEDFEAGHIEPNDEEDIDNLVPICGSCNKGMSQENLIEYKEKHFPNIHINCFWNPEKNLKFAKAKNIISDIPDIIEILDNIEINNNLKDTTEAIKFVVEYYYERNCRPKRVELSGFEMEEHMKVCGDCEHPNSCKELNCRYYYGENVEFWEK